MKLSKDLRQKRKLRIRSKISGTSVRPRLAVYRSNTSLTVQVIDDAKGVTVLSVRSKGKNVTVARELGQKVADLARAKGITTVVFDRGGYQYHGKIKELADSARAGGLKF